jgi:hypothetical protein
MDASIFKGGFKPKSRNNRPLQMSILGLLVILMILSTMYISRADDEYIPMTGFESFDNMYQYHMNQTDTNVEDIMVPVNEVVFFLIKLHTNILGSFMLLICVSSACFAVWYALKPEFADEVSDVKMRVSGGEQIPIDEVKNFVLQFFPDIKANSGIADSYSYEKPSLSLLVRDHLLKFVIFFAIAIAIQQSTLITFIVKSGNALAYGALYYTENTDFKGMVETMTTAGSDYPVNFDTLTTSGQNQGELYDDIYIALKDEKPKDRTDEFLGRIGAATQQFVEVTAPENGVDYSYENFITNVFITSHNNEYSKVSDLEVRMVYPLETFGIIDSDLLGDKYVYMSIMQYDTSSTSTTSSYYTSKLSAGWIESGGIPVSFDLYNIYATEIVNDGYIFVGDDSSVDCTVTIEYSGTGVSEDVFTVSPEISSDSQHLTIDLSEVETYLAAKREDNVNVTLSSVSIDYVEGNGVITLVNSDDYTDSIVIEQKQALWYN